jgi:hypothetical protein
MTTITPSPLPPPTPARRRDLSTYFFLLLVALWVGLVTIGIHGLVWTIDQVILIGTDQALPTWSWLLAAWGQALLLALPLAPLALFVRAPRPRAIYQTWALAAAFVVILGPMRLVPMAQKQAAALAQIGLSLAATAGLLVLAQRRKQKWGWHWGTLLVACALAPLIALPFLKWGALGSPLDTALNLFAGLSLGLFTALLLAGFLIQPLQAAGPRRGDYVLGGLAAGVALLIVGGGFGFGGSQLLLMVCLPPLGFAVMSLSRWTGSDSESPRAWPGIAALMGLAAAAPLMFVDPSELTLILQGNDILSWAFRAAEASILLALVVGLGLRFFRRPAKDGVLLGLGGGALGLTWLLALVFYLVAGLPGFHGEKLFVILKDQADVSSAVNISDRTGRVRFVYTTLTHRADQTQAGLRATLDRLHIAYRPYYLVNALEVDGGPLARAYLSQRPEVDRILDSPQLRPLPEPVSASPGNETAPSAPLWNITSIGADRVWKELGVTGQGIVIGQSDTGVDGQHPALSSQYRGRSEAAPGDDYNWLDPWNKTSAPTDVEGHGTHTLGTILGQNNIGVAPGAEWIGCVNLARNLGNPAVYLNCMQFMLAPYPQRGDPFKDGNPALAPHVLNNSWGCPPLEGCDPNALGPAVSALRAAGIFVVASGGNTGYAGCGSISDPPALYGSAFTVGAVDENGNLADFSSRGPVTVDGSGRRKPDIAAPGVGVLSSTPANTYATYDGTSMAGPHVVGTVALMWSANPKLIGQIDLTEQLLRQTARPYTSTATPHAACDALPLPNNGVGAGLVDAYAAVKAALAAK